MSLGAGHSDSCIITMSSPPMSSTTKNQDKRMRPHIAARCARGVCTLSETNRNGAIC